MAVMDKYGHFQYLVEYPIWEGGGALGNQKSPKFQMESKTEK